MEQTTADNLPLLPPNIDKSKALALLLIRRCEITEKLQRNDQINRDAGLKVLATMDALRLQNNTDIRRLENLLEEHHRNHSQQGVYETSRKIRKIKQMNDIVEQTTCLNRRATSLVCSDSNCLLTKTSLVDVLRSSGILQQITKQESKELGEKALALQATILDKDNICNAKDTEIKELKCNLLEEEGETKRFSGQLSDWAELSYHNEELRLAHDKVRTLKAQSLVDQGMLQIMDDSLRGYILGVAESENSVLGYQILCNRFSDDFLQHKKELVEHREELVEHRKDLRQASIFGATHPFKRLKTASCLRNYKSTQKAGEETEHEAKEGGDRIDDVSSSFPTVSLMLSNASKL